MGKNKRYLLEEIIYWLVLVTVGISFVSFYKVFLYSNYDNVFHRLFAELLINTSLEEMLEINPKMPVLAITYPLYHIVLKVFARLHNWDYFWASYTVLTIVNILSMALFREMLLLMRKTEKIRERILIDAISVAAILFVVARSPLTDWRFYDVQCAPNPVHNPTVLFVRPFGIIAFCAFALVLMRCEKELRYGKELVLFGVSMFVSILAKPVFAYVFLPAMGLVTLFYMIQKKTMKVGFQLLGILIPSLILLVVQLLMLSSGDSAVKIQIIFGGFTGMNAWEVFKASLATFPVVLILFSVKEFKKNFFYRTSILALVIGWLQMFFLSNGSAGDFSWGYDLAVQFSTVTALACAMGGSVAGWRRYVAYAVFAYQAYCGIQYIQLIYEFGEFMI